MVNIIWSSRCFEPTIQKTVCNGIYLPITDKMLSLKVTKLFNLNILFQKSLKKNKSVINISFI